MLKLSWPAQNPLMVIELLWASRESDSKKARASYNIRKDQSRRKKWEKKQEKEKNESEQPEQETKEEEDERMTGN